MSLWRIIVFISVVAVCGLTGWLFTIGFQQRDGTNFACTIDDPSKLRCRGNDILIGRVTINNGESSSEIYCAGCAHCTNIYMSGSPLICCRNGLAKTVSISDGPCEAKLNIFLILGIMCVSVMIIVVVGTIYGFTREEQKSEPEYFPLQ